MPFLSRYSIFMNALEMPQLWGSLINSDLDKDNTSFSNCFFILSSIAPLPPAEYFKVLLAQPLLSLKARGLKKAHVTRYLVLRKNLPPLP